MCRWSVGSNIQSYSTGHWESERPRERRTMQLKQTKLYFVIIVAIKGSHIYIYSQKIAAESIIINVCMQVKKTHKDTQQSLYFPSCLHLNTTDQCFISCILVLINIAARIIYIYVHIYLIIGFLSRILYLARYIFKYIKHTRSRKYTR